MIKLFEAAYTSIKEASLNIITGLFIIITSVDFLKYSVFSTWYRRLTIEWVDLPEMQQKVFV